MRFAPVMLALLLALSPAAVAVQASAPAASTSTASVSAVSPASSVEQTDAFSQTVNENTTAVLTLGSEPERAAFDSSSASLGSSLAMDRDGFRTQLSLEALDQQLSTAESDEKKKRILNEYRYRAENRIISLQAEEQRATAAFSNGTLSEREYLRTLGRIDAKAEEIAKLADALAEQSRDVPRFNLRSEASSLKGQLVTLRGPVRDLIRQTTRGESSATKIYVATSDSGVVLSAVVDNTYVREIVRMDHRDPGATPKLSHVEAHDTVLDRYAWASENIDSGGTNAFRFGSTNVFSVSVSHQHGNLVAYIDGGTEEVFKEVQHKRLVGDQSLPPGPGVQNTTTTAFGSENVTLTVNRTYAGGPLRVELTNETGAPLDAQITVGGESVGQTGSNGALWTLSPAGQFRVSATYEGTTINQTVTSIELEYDSSED